MNILAEENILGKYSKACSSNQCSLHVFGPDDNGIRTRSLNMMSDCGCCSLVEEFCPMVQRPVWTDGTEMTLFAEAAYCLTTI
jgi:hypothetical protein